MPCNACNAAPRKLYSIHQYANFSSRCHAACYRRCLQRPIPQPQEKMALCSNSFPENHSHDNIGFPLNSGGYHSHSHQIQTDPSDTAQVKSTTMYYTLLCTVHHALHMITAATDNHNNAAQPRVFRAKLNRVVSQAPVQKCEPTSFKPLSPPEAPPAPAPPLRMTLSP